MKHYLDLYFNPTGRVSRRTWCRQTVNILAIAALVFVLTTVILLILGAFSFTLLSDTFPSVFAGLEDEPALPMVMPISGVIVIPVVIWCGIALTVKRLHDQDRGAWWLFLLLLPVIGWIVLFILVAFVPATEGSNRYSPEHSIPPHTVWQRHTFNHFRNLYFNPTGRVSRCTWWLHYIIISHVVLFAIAYVVTFLIFIAGSFAGSLVGLEPQTAYIGGIGIAAIILLVGIVWFYFSFMIKRLHDQDRSAAWLLLSFIPFIGGITLLVLAAFWPGTEGINRYGSQPQTHASKQ